MSAERREPRKSPLAPGMLTDAVVVVYALFTVAANCVVIVGGTAYGLAWAGGAVVLACAGACALYVRGTRPWGSYLADAETDCAYDDRAIDVRTLLPRLSALALVLLLWFVTRDAWITWAGLSVCVVGFFVHAYGAPWGSTEARPADAYVSFERTILYAAAFCCALFTLLVVRPRADDTLYLNLALSVVDAPDQALLRVSMLHGPPSATLGVQHVFPPYRVHSFELLGGLIGWLSGIDPVRVIHWGLATAIGWFTPFALARLFRILAPRQWLLCVLCVVSFYFIEGSASRGYANHALARLFNGKAALLTVGVPLLCAYGLRYGARPSGWRLGLLALAQVAALGLSSTAIWLAPTVAMLSVLAGTQQLRVLPQRIAKSVLSSLYVLAVALWVMTQLKVGFVEPGEGGALTQATARLPADVPPRFASILESIEIVLGPTRTAVALLGVALLSVLLSPTQIAARLFASLLLVLSIGFMNPWLAPWIERYVTGASTYHRVFWVLPVPVALGLCCALCWEQLRARFKNAMAGLLTAAALSAFYLTAVDRLVVSEANGSRLQFPPVLKLPPITREIAEEVCKVARKGSYVLASQGISQQLPIISGCAYPLLTEDRWMSVSAQEWQTRDELARYVSGPEDVPPERAAWFLDMLARYKVDAVVISREANRNRRAKSLVRIASFERASVLKWDHIFIRPSAERRARLAHVAKKVCSLSDQESVVLAPFGVSHAIAKRGCAKVVASESAYRAASPAQADDILDLERLTYLASNLPQSGEAWLEQALQRHAVSWVVFNQHAMGDARVRAVLKRLGFRRAAAVENCTVFRGPR